MGTCGYSVTAMRPAILFPLFAEIRILSGVGPKLEKLIAKVAGPRLVDLVFDLPVGVVDRSYRPKLAAAEPGRIATVEVTVLEHRPNRVKAQPYKVMVSDETSLMELVFFRAHADYLTGLLPVGARRLLSGRIERFKDRLQMAHPDYVVALQEASSFPLHEPVYGLTEGLTARPMAKAVRGALEKLPAMPEWQDPAFVKQRKWQDFGAALEIAHGPAHDSDLEPTTPARQRLAYDELLANQLALLLIRANLRGGKGRAVSGTGKLKALAVAALPFALTDPQLAALAEIEQDMKSDKRMLRLLQGDVGSGKTVVALLAMLSAVEAGLQAALMAPTELLVRQHLASLEPYANAAGVRLACLTGREKGAARDTILAKLAAGEIDILIGTHALFSEDVTFKDLGLAVVDEQHRFGVHQRMQLQSKGKPADVLVMTATPIPRTLALTAYGDMDVSKITGRPPGRKPVETRVMNAERLEELVPVRYGRMLQSPLAFYRGSAAGLTSVDTPLGSDVSLEEFGAAVANAGDVDGDGYADVLIGHPGYGANRGRVELYRGGPGGIPGPADYVFESQDDGARFGASVATLGDINADGYADFAVGAPYDSTADRPSASSSNVCPNRRATRRSSSAGWCFTNSMAR